MLRTMKNKAFTLIEILCLIVILSVLSAILFPVFAKANISAKAGSAKQNLHGFWLGIKIYQSDNDERSEAGEPENMGLPPVNRGWVEFVNNYTGDHHDGWINKKQFLPCGSRTNEVDSDGLWYMPQNQADWKKEVEKRGEDTVLIFDKNCNMWGTRVMCQFCSKRSIGVTLGGSLKDRTNSDWPAYDQRFYQN
jgi:prepilin-type N-terminal cleavage/methylation domain-containing protein